MITCGTSSTNRDAWYAYTASCSGTLTVTTCGTHDATGVDTGMDTVISLHSGCPGTTGNQLICNDDNAVCGALDTGLIRDSGVTLAVSTGQVVLIRVSHFSTVIDDGNYTLRTSLTPEPCIPALSTGSVALNCFSGPTSTNVTLFNNSDCTSMNWSSSSPCGFVSTSPSNGSIPPNGSQIVAVQTNCAATPCGANVCNVLFSTSGCSPSSVSLTANVFGYPVTVYCTGKTNSLGCVPAIGTNGVQPSISAGNFTVTCTNVLNQKNGLLFWGYVQSNVPFQGGIKCVASPVVRGPNISSGGPTSGNSCTGNYAHVWTTAYFGAYGVTPGSTLYGQWWMRDPASPSTTGLSNAVCFMACP